MRSEERHLLLLGDEQVHLIHEQDSHALALRLAVLSEHPLQVLGSCRRRRVLPCQRLQPLTQSVTDVGAVLRERHV